MFLLNKKCQDITIGNKDLVVKKKRENKIHPVNENAWRQHIILTFNVEFSPHRHRGLVLLVYQIINVNRMHTHKYNTPCT